MKVNGASVSWEDATVGLYLSRSKAIDLGTESGESSPGKTAEPGTRRHGAAIRALRAGHGRRRDAGAGAQLLRALGVRGPEAEVYRASGEFQGHCLALALLGSYLSDVYNGYIRCRDQVQTHLVDDVRQGGHAHKVMASYQRWWGEGPELSVLRLLGFFDTERLLMETTIVCPQR